MTSRCVWMLAVYLGCTALNGWAAPTIDNPSIADIEREVLDHRRALRSGHVRIQQKWHSTSPVHDERTQITTWFDGPLARDDELRDGVTTTVCFGKEHWYEYSNISEVSGHGPHMVLVVKDLKLAARKKTQDYVHEPRMLMLFPYWYRNADDYHTESFVNASERERLQLKKTSWSGLDAWEISFIRPKNGSWVRYLVVPSRSYNIVQMQLGIEISGERYENAVRCSLQQVRSDLWFPQNIRYTGEARGTIIREEDLTVEVLSLNERIDPVVFTPVAMNVPSGTSIMRIPPDPRGELKWDGTRMVVMSSSELLSRMAAPQANAPVSRSPTRRLLLAISAGLALLVAGYFGWRYVRRMRNAARMLDSGKP